jgi:HK97 family phage prohead protease
MDRAIIKQAFLDSSDKAVDPDAPMTFVASTEAVDRYGDIVRADGWELANFKRNPVALFGHNYSSIVGLVPRVWIESKRLMAEIKLAAQGTSALVDSVRALVAQKILRAVSVSFLPMEEPTLMRDEKNDRVTGYEFTKQDLLEISLVAVPANQEAIAVARSLGISDDMQRALFVPAFRGISAGRARVEFEKLTQGRR